MSLPPTIAALHRRVRERPVVAAALGTAILLSLVNAVVNVKMGADTAYYYTRLAAAFGRGDYGRAFFHTVPPLVPVLAGLLAKLGFSGWAAMKIVSAVFYVGAIWFAYRLAALRLPDRQAQWAAVLYLCCSRLLRYGMAGQLDAGNMFFLVFTAERLLRAARERRWSCLLQGAVGAGLMGLTRNEGIAYTGIWGLLVVAGPWLYPADGRRLGRALARTVVFTAVVLAIWAPCVVWQYRTSGVPLVTARQAGIAARLFPFLHVTDSPYLRAREAWYRRLWPDTYPNPPAPPAREVRGGWQGVVDRWRDPQPATVQWNVIETAKGWYPRFLWLALVGVVVLARRGRWRREDTVFAAIILYQVAVFGLLLPNIQKRLVIPIVVLYFPWLIGGARGLLVRGRACGWRLGRNRIVRLVGLLAAAALVWDGMTGVRDSLRGKEKHLVRLAAWVKAHRPELNVNPAPPLPLGMTTQEYYTGQQPIIATNAAQIGGWADTDVVLLARVLYAPSKTLPQVLADKHVDAVILSPAGAAEWPETQLAGPIFRPVHSEGPYTVYTVHLE